MENFDCMAWCAGLMQLKWDTEFTYTLDLFHLGASGFWVVLFPLIAEDSEDAVGQQDREA